MKSEILNSSFILLPFFADAPHAVAKLREL